MRTPLMIGVAVGGVLLLGLLATAGLVWWLGWALGVLVVLMALAVLAALYWLAIKPWHLRWWGTLPRCSGTPKRASGDELIPDAKPATRAISIHAPPEAVWPWMVQLGFGKAGWYSYDWIDNDRLGPAQPRSCPSSRTWRSAT